MEEEPRLRHRRGPDHLFGERQAICRRRRRTHRLAPGVPRRRRQEDARRRRPKAARCSCSRSTERQQRRGKETEMRFGSLQKAFTVSALALAASCASVPPTLAQDAPVAQMRCGCARTPAICRSRATIRPSPASITRSATPIGKALGRPVTHVWYRTYFGKRAVRVTMLAKQCDATIGLPDSDDFMGPKVIFSKPLFNLGYAIVAPKGQSYRERRGPQGQARRGAVRDGAAEHRRPARRHDGRDGALARRGHEGARGRERRRGVPLGAERRLSQQDRV